MRASVAIYRLFKEGEPLCPPMMQPRWLPYGDCNVDVYSHPQKPYAVIGKPANMGSAKGYLLFQDFLVCPQEPLQVVHPNERRFRVRKIEHGNSAE